MIEDPKEVHLGNGGYIVNEDGDILPLEDGFSYAEHKHSDGEQIDDVSIENHENTTPERKSQQERLRAVYETHGFLPHSAGELNHIVGIDRYGHGPASYIASIMRHQGNIGHDDKTVKTATSITNDFESYRNDARPVLSYLMDLAQDVREAEMDGEDIVREFTKLDNGEARALGHVVRRSEILDFIQAEATNKKYAFAQDKDYRDRSEEFLKSLNGSAHVLLEQVERAQAEEQRRLSYWIDCIDQIKERVLSIGSEAARRIVEDVR